MLKVAQVEGGVRRLGYILEVAAQIQVFFYFIK